MVEIEAWKKILIIVGMTTQTIALFIDSNLLHVLGLMSIIIGMIAMFLFK